MTKLVLTLALSMTLAGCMTEYERRSLAPWNPNVNYYTGYPMQNSTPNSIVFEAARGQEINWGAYVDNSIKAYNDNQNQTYQFIQSQNSLPWNR